MFIGGGNATEGWERHWSRKKRAFPLGHNIIRLAEMICILKVVYWVVILLAAGLWGNFSYFTFLDWPQNTTPTLSSHLIPYDGSFYLYLAEAGYQAGQKACAFYPLWPLVIRWVSSVTGGNMLITGLVLSNMISLAGWLIFYQLVFKRWGAGAAKWAVASLVMGSSTFVMGKSALKELVVKRLGGPADPEWQARQ